MKSETDRHWSERAASVADDLEVNIMDVFQRELEYDYVCAALPAASRVLEVGCGNGYSTRRFRAFVEHVDAFDYSEQMIERARENVGEENNRFFVDNVLDPQTLESSAYDVVVCVRVLINLRDLDEQRRAVGNMTRSLAPGGVLILAEGFTDGFHALDALRQSLGLPGVAPARINFYSAIDDLLPELERDYVVEGRFHLGAYDYLTRVFYPLLVGPEQAIHNTEFSERASELARVFNPDSFEGLSRMRGFVLRRRA